MTVLNEYASNGGNVAVRGQDSAYRRGLVLGLTMAEIMVLVLFLLLLALAASFAKYSKSAQELALLQEALQRAGVAPGATTVTDIIEKLERQRNELESLRQRMKEHSIVERDARILQDIVQKIQREQPGATDDQIRARLERLPEEIRENETLRGQLAQLSREIKKAGRGNEFPSCWVTPSGGTVSIFELTLTGSGVIVKDHNPGDRIADKAMLPLAQVQYDAELPLDVFLNQMRPIHKWSVGENCRFYVMRFSSVRNAPIQLVNAIDAMFYPDSTIRFRPPPDTPAPVPQAP